LYSNVSIQGLNELPDVQQQPIVNGTVLDLRNRNTQDLTGLSSVTNIELVETLRLNLNGLGEETLRSFLL